MDNYYVISILVLTILLIVSLLMNRIQYRTIQELKDLIIKLECKNRDLSKLNKIIEDYNKNLEDVAFGEICKTRYEKFVAFLHKLKNRFILLIKRVKKHI